MLGLIRTPYAARPCWHFMQGSLYHLCRLPATLRCPSSNGNCCLTICYSLCSTHRVTQGHLFYINRATGKPEGTCSTQIGQHAYGT